MKIIYKIDSGLLAIIDPVAEALSTMTVDQIAQKDVPYNKPYKIVGDDYIPADRTFRDAWTINDSELTDGVGADYGVGSDKRIIGYDKDHNLVVVTEEQYVYLVEATQV